MCSPQIVGAVHAELARSGLSRRGLLLAAGAAGVAAAGAVTRPVPARAVPTGRVVDLTHALSSDFPVWPGNAPFVQYPVAVAGTGSSGGFSVNNLHLCEHTGTHLDAPAHLGSGLGTDLLDPAGLVAPLVVVDIAERATGDVEATVTPADLEGWERAHGAIPARAFVAMHSGWAQRLDRPGAFVNADATGRPHAPGFSGDAVRWLIDRRDVVGIGSDTLSIDRAADATTPAHLLILGSGRYAVEVLAGLDRVPAAGATVVVGAPKHVGGTGGPCRVLALLPA